MKEKNMQWKTTLLSYRYSRIRMLMTMPHVSFEHQGG